MLSHSATAAICRLVRSSHHSRPPYSPRPVPSTPGQLAAPALQSVITSQIWRPNIYMFHSTVIAEVASNFSQTSSWLSAEFNEEKVKGCPKKSSSRGFLYQIYPSLSLFGPKNLGSAISYSHSSFLYWFIDVRRYVFCAFCVMPIFMHYVYMYLSLLECLAMRLISPQPAADTCSTPVRNMSRIAGKFCKLKKVVHKNHLMVSVMNCIYISPLSFLGTTLL